MISSLIESMLEAIDKVLSEGRISWGAVITALLFFNKINKYKEFRARDKRVEQRQLRIESKIDDLMEKLGVESKWSIQEIGSTHTVQPSSKPWLKLSQVVTILRRLKIMDKLKSRKFWMAIIAVIIPVINSEFGLNLDTPTIIGVLSAILGYIAVQGHVDAKAVQNGGSTDAKPTGDSGPAV